MEQFADDDYMDEDKPAPNSRADNASKPYHPIGLDEASITLFKDGELAFLGPDDYFPQKPILVGFDPFSIACWQQIKSKWADKIRRISSCQIAAPNDLSEFFKGCCNLTDIGGLENWYFGELFEPDTNVQGMFEGCSSLADLRPIASWDVDAVEFFDFMFEGCSSLQTLDALANWDVSAAQSMSAMFNGCKRLVGLDGLAGWDVSSVEDFDFMFSGCAQLTDLSPIAGWDVSAMNNATYMFEGCSSLRSAEDLEDWDVPDDADTTGMFLCSYEHRTLTPSWYEA